jgi:hypothetical protein
LVAPAGSVSVAAVAVVVAAVTRCVIGEVRGDMSKDWASDLVFAPAVLESAIATANEGVNVNENVSVAASDIGAVVLPLPSE